MRGSGPAQACVPSFDEPAGPASTSNVIRRVLPYVPLGTALKALNVGRELASLAWEVSPLAG